VGGRRLGGVGAFVLACVGVAAVATLAGVLFEVVRGGTTVARSVAYALWIAAALALVLMVPAGSRIVWRSSRIRPIESWWLVAAATVLAVVGAVVDALGGT
jgi:hypothetical protein